MARRDITVRPALHKDISALTGMARALGEGMGTPPDLLDKDAIANFLFGADRWADALIAFDADHRALGYITFSRQFEPHDGARILRLGDLYVMASARGQGFGQSLVRAAAKRAVSLKCRALVYDMRYSNEAGRSFFGNCPGGADNDVQPWRAEGEALDELAQT
jgi:ribosomal protein S18 acetylase RimI-like enzyme